MSVIPFSQLELSRTRRDLEKALHSGDWQSVGTLDKRLEVVMDAAATDVNRDIGSLLGEMGSLINLYKEMMDVCHEQEQQLKLDRPFK
jgi:hypothetical protein